MLAESIVVNTATSTPEDVAKKNSIRLGDMTVELDQQGIPVMPEELIKFRDMVLDTSSIEGNMQIRRIAEKAYEIWEDANKGTVTVNPQDASSSIPACYKARIDFTIEPPIWDEMDSANPDHEFEMEMAKFWIIMSRCKQICSQCPLQMQCLTRSITLPVYGRDRQIDQDRLRMEEFGIWGGYGVSGREMIQQSFLSIWGERDPE